MNHQERGNGFDWLLFAAVTTLALLGVINLYSAVSSGRLALTQLYLQQIYWLTIGGVVAVLISKIDPRLLRDLAWPSYVAGIALLCFVFFAGQSIRGSARWISLGGFSFQPSEIMKICLILAMAKYLQRNTVPEGRDLRHLLVPALILLPPVVLIMLQPDLGTTLILCLIFFSIMLLMRLRLKTLLILVVTTIMSTPLAWRYLLRDYQKDRLTAFLNPESDLLDTGWHAHQSIISIGSGGVVGKGFMQGTQNQFRFLPDPYTDFPFSVWSEEQGLLGALFLLALFVFIILWALKIGWQARDRFGAVTATGVAALFFWHTIFNLCMVMGWMPVVGVTLPFFSYGGSSTLTSSIGIGLLLNISDRRASL